MIYPSHSLTLKRNYFVKLAIYHFDLFGMTFSKFTLKSLRFAYLLVSQ